MYLSNIALEFVPFVFAAVGAPSSPSLNSLSGFCAPPQNITNASRPLILIPKLLVLLNTAATTGKSSFLVVEKSRTAKTVGRHPKDLSMIEWVGDSRPSWRIGNISAND